MSEAIVPVKLNVTKVSINFVLPKTICYFCNMKVYYYHTTDIQTILNGWRKGTYPGHFLYGATHLEAKGIGVVWHKFHFFPHRWQQSLYVAWQVLTCREHFDAIYATTFRGLEIIVFLRALGLYRKPICVWHHQPVVTAKSGMRECVARLFYRGLDELFFFSQKIIDDSLQSKKARRAHMHIARWGADLDYYDRLLRSSAQASTAPFQSLLPEIQPHRHGFISTGKEMRDMPTLVSAFRTTEAPLDIYICHAYGGTDYEKLFNELGTDKNTHVHFIEGLAHQAMSLKVNAAACVVICCKETNYTVGLTTVVEALALGIPLICSRNPQMPVDIDREKCGITVDYYDTEGWINAIRYMVEHPEEAAQMGQRGRAFAEKELNLANCAEDVAQVLSHVCQAQS